MLRLFTAMMHQTFSQEPFLVSGLHGDQILGARSNQQDSFSILAGEDILVLVLADGTTILVRPSGTEPKIKTYFTTLGKTLEEAQAQKDALAAAIEPILK